MDAKQLNPSVLAFVGDAVYGLLVREKLADTPRKSGELHTISVKLVNATAQSKAYELIKDLLNENETAIFKRGRNFHTSSCPKNSKPGDYHTATGLEALFGFLYLSQNSARADELFKIIWDSFKNDL